MVNNDRLSDVALGGNLKHARVAAALSQRELGARCSPPVSSQQISKYESGEDKISASRLLEFAEILQCRLGLFYQGLTGKIPLVGGDCAETATHIRSRIAELNELVAQARHKHEIMVNYSFIYNDQQCPVIVPTVSQEV